MVTARQVMTTPVITVAATASVDDVAEALKRHGIRAVPVTDEVGADVGLVSELDVQLQDGDECEGGYDHRVDHCHARHRRRGHTPTLPWPTYTQGAGHGWRTRGWHRQPQRPIPAHSNRMGGIVCGGVV